MRNPGLWLIALASGFAIATACGGESESGSDSDSGGSAGTSGTAGSSGKGGSGGSATGGAGGEETGGAAGTGGAAALTLTVEVGEAPEGTTPEVTIEGPGGFSETITETTTFTDLEPGSYNVTTDVESARVDGTLIDTIFDVSIEGSPADLESGAEAISVAWPQRPGTGMLWMGNFDSRQVLGYTADQLESSNDELTPAVVLGLPELAADAVTGAIAFDEDGNLWVGYCAGGGSAPQAVAKFSPEKLGQAGSPEPDLVITTPDTAAHDCVGALAPDPDGGLWVGFFDAGVVKYSSAQLEESGAPTPAISITNTTLFATLDDLLLDPDGNLWIAACTNNSVHKLTPSQLEDSATDITPAVSWTGTIACPTGLALGPAPAPRGIWVSNYDDGVLASFAADAATGSPPPDIAVASNELLEFAEQIAFDEQGNLWVALSESNSAPGNQLVRFDAANLTTGDRNPDVVIESPEMQIPYGLRLNPGIE